MVLRASQKFQHGCIFLPLISQTVLSQLEFYLFPSLVINSRAGFGLVPEARSEPGAVTRPTLVPCTGRECPCLPDSGLFSSAGNSGFQLTDCRESLCYGDEQEGKAIPHPHPALTVMQYSIRAMANWPRFNSVDTQDSYLVLIYTHPEGIAK